MAKNPVGWFEIPVNDFDRAKSFYEAVFGSPMQAIEMDDPKMVSFSMEDGTYGSSGALVKGEGYVPSHSGTMVYFSVEDIEATLAKVGENWGKVLVPKTEIGKYGFVGHFEDTEGNRVGLHSM